MGFTRSSEDISVHQKLGDFPNQDDGLTPEELKKRYDKPAETLQNDLNRLEQELEEINASTSIGANPIDANDDSEPNIQAKLIRIYEQLQNVILNQIPDGSITKAKLNADYSGNIAEKTGELQTNLNAERINGFTSEELLIAAGENKPYTVGTYTGDGATTKTINLDFTPQAVIVRGAGGTSLSGGSLAVTGSPYKGFGNKTVLTITTNGFIVSKDNNNSQTNANATNEIYNYIAFK